MTSLQSGELISGSEGSQLPFDDRHRFFAGVQGVKETLADEIRNGKLDEEAAAELYREWYGDAAFGQIDPQFKVAS